MNKKASLISMEMPIWFFNIFILIVIVLIFAIAVSSFISRDIDTERYESLVLMNNVRSCLAYTDERTNLGIIDESKFANINSCLSTQNLQYGLILEDLNGKNIGSFYLDKAKFETDWNLRKVKLENQEFKFFSGKDYVLVNKEGKNQGVILTYQFIVKNA